jgi:glycosyltransferase involved in cell wall biosynthesis
MKISGFTYIRNGFRYGYPFLESMQSILPICDELVVAVGDSDDGTREAIAALSAEHGDKIKIIDTVWDDDLRHGGHIFAQQSNIALSHISGDWAFHIQADEVIHEQDLETIRQAIEKADKNPKIEGFLFDFLNFHGSYDYLNDSRRQHLREVRIFRHTKNVFSYRDSQGFRRYPSAEDYYAGHKGEKLNVLNIGAPVYHYSYVRPPEKMQQKSKYFERFWHDDQHLDQKYKQAQQDFDYYNIERVRKFEGSQPAVMRDIIAQADWDFDPNKLHKKLSLKERFIYWLEARLGRRLGEYKNYILIS